MKRILVPTDFSPVSLEAIKFAVDLAKVSGGEILMLHVLNIPVTYTTDLDGFDYSFDPRIIKELHDRAYTKFEKWKKKHAATTKSIEFFVENGPVVNVIEQFTKKNKIDLVIMGTHGVSGLKEFFIGSNTEKVVRFSKVPVISVHKAIAVSSIKNIVFPTRLNLNAIDLVNQIKSLQKFFKARLHIVYINTPVNFKKQNQLEGLLKDYVKHYSFTNSETHIVNDPYEHQGIVDFANAMPGAMIAMSTHGRRGLAHFFNLSIAEEVVNHVNCPIWTCVFNENKR